MTNQIPLGLQQSIESGECVLFIGAGIGKNVFDSDGKCAPMAMELANELADYFKVDIDGDCDLAKVAQVVEITKGRPNLEGFIRKRLAGLVPDDTVKWLTTQRWKAIYTTNYDNCLQKAYGNSSAAKQQPITMSLTSQVQPLDSRYEVPIIHLHGTLFDVEKPHIVLTQTDYAHFRDKRRMLFEMLKIHFVTSTILYLGYSNEDPNWKVVLEELTKEYFPSSIPPSYRVAPSTNQMDRIILQDKNITTLDMSTEEFVRCAAAELREAVIDPEKAQASKRKIPSDLLDAFEKNPASVFRLCESWEYVKQVPFNLTANTRDFLRGDRPNWSLIAAKVPFERDIESDVYDAILDFVAGDSDKPKACIIVGSAGYGITTMIMSLCVKVSQEGAQGVFFLKPGRVVLEGDIEFASSLFPERPIFFIDNAAEHSPAVFTLIHKFQDYRRAALFVLGARINEWSEGNSRVRGKEFEILPLSDAEIDRLLDCLGRHSELGVLQELDRQLQFDVVKEKHKKQLLVTMREATEGRSFDAIIESEFFGIKDELARRFYLLVCFIYQHGIHVRDDLLAQLLSVKLEELYDTIAAWTTGVVVYESIDQERGKFAARARHRIIAEIVWERCADLEYKESLPLDVISRLNLNFTADKDAFEAFIQSDAMVDAIKSVENRIQFFEIACKRDPTSPYVRQHYARMLSRLKMWTLALEQIDAGIKLDPEIKALYHTKGLVQKKIALELLRENGRELARKRMVLSQGCFDEVIRRHAKDEYGYHGLAELFLDWAKNCGSEEEALKYIAKAELVIENALKVVYRRDRLLVVSSHINDYLGDKPGAVAALEKAVNDQPESNIARYLLGRRYRKSSRAAEALEVLKPVIHKHFDEYRSFLEYALSLLDTGAPYSAVSAVLALSTRYGMRDAAYVAVYAGVLFMNGDFTGSEKVFAEGQRQQFAAEEERKVFFRPSDRKKPDQPVKLSGKVIIVKAGFSFIEVDGYPQFFCPGSKHRGISLQKGMYVAFEPAFTARGQIADNVELVPTLLASGSNECADAL